MGRKETGPWEARGARGRCKLSRHLREERWGSRETWTRRKKEGGGEEGGGQPPQLLVRFLGPKGRQMRVSPSKNETN